jgi:E3 ubiquitin-protein ligase RFWD3
MGIDAANQIILASRKAPAVFGEHVLTKVCLNHVLLPNEWTATKFCNTLLCVIYCQQINMSSNYEARNIQLPPDTKVVKDICILPGGSALYASLGKRLSLLRFVLNL